MKLVGYCRVSTQEQALEGHSLGAQAAKLTAYCDLYGHQLVRTITDAGQSAKTLDRPGLKQALTMLTTGQAEGFLVLKMDRLTRSVKNLGELLETYFQKYALHAVTEQCDTSSAAGRMVLNMLMSVSQFEREAISERTCLALQYKKSQGCKLGAPALTNTAAIDRMKVLRAEDLTFAGIAQQLTVEGFETKRGGRWYAGTVQKVLAREGII